MRRPLRAPHKPLRVIHDPNELPFLCNAAEAGLLLRITPERVCKMAKDGILPGAKQGQAWYFRRDDLLDYLNRIFDGGGTD